MINTWFQVVYPYPFNLYKCENFMKLYDAVWWHKILYLGNDIVWWYMMLCDAMWWYMMLYYAAWWHVMIYDAMWWHMMLYDAIWLVNVCMCVCVYLFIYMYVCMYVWGGVYVYVCMQRKDVRRGISKTKDCIVMCIYICVCASVPVSLCAYMHI
jgi:hypothetical protein